jgi:hypothetical protein
VSSTKKQEIEKEEKAENKCIKNSNDSKRFAYEDKG